MSGDESSLTPTTSNDAAAAPHTQDSSKPSRAKTRKSLAASNKTLKACRRCHRRKVKCSGELPCRECLKLGYEDQCGYAGQDDGQRPGIRAPTEQRSTPVRSRKATTSLVVDVADAQVVPASSTEVATIETMAVPNPLYHEKAWFYPYDFSRSPLYVAEASCTAFATRFRQSMNVSEELTRHFPRIHFITDETLSQNENCNNNVLWPSKPLAQLLIKSAHARVNRAFHIFMLKATLSSLDQAYQDLNNVDSAYACKFFALFALGQVSSSSRDTSQNTFPGLDYFKQATKILQHLPERVGLEHIEAMVLLSFYSHNVNRRKSAYNWIGDALRCAISMGLHHSLPSNTGVSPIVKEHRVCLWWSIYCCDRFWSSKLGYPVGITDTDIGVGLPSKPELNDVETSELPNTDYILAMIRLARIAGNIIGSIYRLVNPPPFVPTVQKVLRELNSWASDLAPSVRLAVDGGPQSRPVVSIHLSFNQCVILATRPVLLHVFEKSRMSAQSEESAPQDTIITTLTDSCVQAARHSVELLINLWTEGQLAPFGYFDAQYIFSSSMILLISGLIHNKSKDNDLFESAAQLLEFLAKNGNLSATEFCGHLDQVRQSRDLYRLNTIGAGQHIATTDNTPYPITTEMVLGQIPMQDFLMQNGFMAEQPAGWLQQDDPLFYGWSNPIQM